MANVWKNHQFHIWCITLGIILFPTTNGSLLSECNSQCSISTVVQGDTTAITECDTSCKTTSCETGCSTWDNSTLSECYTVCNNTYTTEPDRVQYCQTGCLLAEDAYATEIIGQVGEPSAPVPSNIGSTTLTLTWGAASNQDVTYLVEWRYAEGGGSAWNYYGSAQPISETSLDLTGLIPYAVYRFRVVWVVTPRHTLTSNETTDVRTLESGVPSSAPTITSVTSSTPTTISLTWAPPPFPNGPIIGYSIAVQSFLNQPAVVRSVAGSVTQATVIDASFQPSTLYAVYVSARNMEGLGPSDTVNITTAAAPNVTGVVPYLVVGVTALDVNVLHEASIVSFVEFDQLGESILEQNDIHTVDSENTTITDVAVHYWQGMVFISDSEGRIHRRTIDPANLTLAASEVLYSNQTPPPSKLDVDWLNDGLFFVQGTQIYQCDLNVSSCSVAVDNIASTPFEMKVDPYLGYLFWSVPDSGIYRISLASLPGDASSAQLIVSMSGMSAFTLNTDSYQVLYANSTGDSLHSVLLDGSERETLRSLGAGDMHQFENTTSIVYFNNTFTWTHVGEQSVGTCFFGAPSYPYAEENNLYYEESPNVISNSGLFLCTDGYHGLDVFHPSYQPIPVPAYPPTDLQALFTDDTADISWTRPQSIPGKGPGAWEEWLYEVTVTDQETGEETTMDGIPEVFAVVENLNASSEYSVQVRAYSHGGFGPQSDAFSGTTLVQVAVDPYLLLANESQVWRTGLDGNSDASILSPPSPVKDIDWYKGYYIWSTTENELYRAIEGSTTSTKLTVDPASASSSVRAIAVDWLSEFIYWADQAQSQIIRGRLSSGSVVTSPRVIQPFANNVQDLAIDSVQAYIYWTTSRTVEGARLNGESPLQYYATGDLSLDVIAGLTLDLSGGYVYWFVLSRQDSDEELKLFRAQLAGSSSDPASTAEEIGDVLSATTSLDLHFYSSKLFWINSEFEVVVSDDLGQRQALLPASGVQTLTIVQETLKPLPAGYSQTPTVVAQEIPPSSIQVTGSWDDFNITWRASTEVTYGTVFYTLSVTAASGETYNTIVQDASYNIRNLSPFQSLDVIIEPYTYWAFTPATTTTNLTSPMSVPSIPLDPRAFGLEDTNIMTGNTQYSAEFRWSPPSEINGILEGYNISWGTDGEQLSVVMVTENLANLAFTYTFPDLIANTTYYFQVEGFTSVGSGPSTSPVSITTGVSLPPPTIVVSTGTGVTLTDVDSGESSTLLGDTAVSVLAFVARETISFYVESGKNEILQSAFTEGTPQGTLVVDVTSNKPSSQATFVIDWITQILYWSDGMAILRYDTTMPSSLATTETIYTSPAGRQIGGIAVSPHGRSFVWTEISQTASVLMTSDLNGQNPSPLFGQSNRRRRAAENCTCSDTFSPGSVVYVDSSDASAPSLYLIDAATNDLWVSDLDGCQCRLLFVAASQMNTGLPPDSLSVDSARIYWSNSTQGIVANIDKQSGADFQSQMVQTDFVLTYGTSLQPFPAPECLAPADYSQQAQLTSSGSDSLTLTLDPVPQCPDVSTATVLYTVHYAAVNETSDQNCTSGGLSCDTQETATSPVSLGGLEPYTFYLTQVSATNLYSIGTPEPGPVAVHRTSPGGRLDELSSYMYIIKPMFHGWLCM